MQNELILDTALIDSWVQSKLEPEAVERQLKLSGLSEEQIAAYMKAYRKERHAGRRFTGFLLAAVGAFLGFVSCVLTIVNPIPALYNVILFGLTSVAILLVCAGLYYLFE